MKTNKNVHPVFENILDTFTSNNFLNKASNESQSVRENEAKEEFCSCNPCYHIKEEIEDNICALCDKKIIAK